MAEAGALSGGELAAVLGLSQHESALSVYAVRTGAAADRWARAKAVSRAVETALVGLLQLERSGWTFYERTAVDEAGARYMVVARNAPWPEPEWPPRWLVAVVQWAMLQAGESRALIGVLVEGHAFKVGEMGANPEMQAQLQAAADAFLERLAQGVPPEPSDHPADLPALKRLYPRDDGHAVALGPKAQDMWDRCRIRRASAAHSKAQAEKDEARIRAVMKEHSIGILPDGRRLSARLVNGGRRLVELQAQGRPARV